VLKRRAASARRPARGRRDRGRHWSRVAKWRCSSSIPSRTSPAQTCA